MIRPQDVHYTKAGVPDVLYECESYAIARLIVNNRQIMAFRWNGTESADSMGTPTANGKPTWMFLPEDFLQQLGFVLDKIRK